MAHKQSANFSLAYPKFNISLEESKHEKPSESNNLSLIAFEPTSSIKLKYKAKKCIMNSMNFSESFKQNLGEAHNERSPNISHHELFSPDINSDKRFKTRIPNKAQSYASL